MTQMRLKTFLLFANSLDVLMKPIDQRDIHATHVQQQPPQRTHASGTDPSLIHRRSPRLAIFVMRPPWTKSIANQLLVRTAMFRKSFNRGASGQSLAAVNIRTDIPIDPPLRSYLRSDDQIIQKIVFQTSITLTLNKGF